MLTNHCYDNIRDDWDKKDPDRTILDCCVSNNPDDPTCSDCCYDEWQDKLKIISQDYKQEGERADQIKKRLVFITDRRDRYRTWVMELEKTEIKARLICHQLDLILSQSDKIWYNARKAAQAIEILFCMVRDFYFQVDYIKKRYDDLQVCISMNHDPSLVKGQGILKYLDEYSQKLDTVIKTRDDIIKAVMETIKLAHLISNNISTNQVPLNDPANPYDPCKSLDCPDCKGPEKFYGFKTIICEWHRELKCSEDCIVIDPCAEKEDQKPEQQQQQQQKGREQQQEVGYDKGCEDDEETDTEADDKDKCKDTTGKCHLRPVFCFPICNDGYKLTVDGWLADDEKTVACLTTELKKATKRKEALQACRDSLVKAINEVNPAERCK